MKGTQRKDWTFRITKKEMAEITMIRRAIIAQGKVTDLKDLLLRAHRAFGDNICIVDREKGTPVAHTYIEFKDKIDALGTALIALGYKGKHIAVLAENSFDWLVAFFAVACGVGVAVPLDKELDDATLSKLIDKADCEAVFCTKPYFKTVQKHFETHPDFGHAISMYRDGPDDRFVNIDALIEQGKKRIAEGDRSFLDAKIDPEQLMAILFTSGTTGANKGVMLSHRNLMANVNKLIATIPTEFSSFSVLPMNHVYELCCNCFTALYMNAVIYINDSLKNIQKNLLEFKPEAMAVVPMVIEGLYAGIWANAKKQGRDEILKKLVAFSNKMRKEKGIDLRPVLFKTIRENFCARKFPTLSCGGAPSRAEYMTGMGDFGFRIYNGYGMTESSPSHTLNMHAELDPESAGTPMPGCKVYIADPDEDGIGEIWIQGDNVFSGYYKDPEATAASFESGWFKTGDYGRLTSGNELFVSGRKKNLIILENGENIFPEDLEFQIMDNIGYVTEVVAIEALREILGREQKVICAVTYIDPAQFPDKTAEEIEQMYRQDISALNKKLPSYKKIQDIVLVDKEMEKNSTRKIVRQKVIDRYSKK